MGHGSATFKPIDAASGRRPRAAHYSTAFSTPSTRRRAWVVVKFESRTSGAGGGARSILAHAQGQTQASQETEVAQPGLQPERAPDRQTGNPSIAAGTEAQALGCIPPW